MRKYLVTLAALLAVVAIPSVLANIRGGMMDGGYGMMDGMMGGYGMMGYGAMSLGILLALWGLLKLIVVSFVFSAVFWLTHNWLARKK